MCGLWRWLTGADVRDALTRSQEVQRSAIARHNRAVAEQERAADELAATQQLREIERRAITRD